MKLDKHKLITAGLVGITACSGMIMASAYADTPASSSSSANASITVSNTINLTLTGGDLVIDNLTPGSSSDSNIITATITSNSPYGYHLSATTGTSTGTTSLVNTADSNFSFANLNANKASLSNFSDNTWGYSYSTDNGTSWISGDYGTALSGYNGLTLDNDDSGATGTTLYNNDSYAGSTAVKFKIGAKSATTQAAGTYTGTVNFYAVTNPKPSTFEEAYAFAGKTKTNGYYSLQDMTPSICYLTDQGNTTEVIDIRDNTIYHVGKLADNRCWMLDNLALDLTNETVVDNLSIDNTNASNEALYSLRSGNRSTGDQYATQGLTLSEWEYGYSYSEPLVKMVAKDIIPDRSYGIGFNKVGGYYNYCAASAGSFCYDGNYTIVDVNTQSLVDSEEDICPKGWRMPTAGSSDAEYNTLLWAIAGSYGYVYGDGAVEFRTQLSLPLAGTAFGNSITDHGSYGRYASSTLYNSSIKMIQVNHNREVQPYESSGRDTGLTVRCILR